MADYKLEIVFSESPADASKAPLLFVHGAYLGAWCWQMHFMPYFVALGFPCYALSFRGHGNSGGSEDLAAWRIADYVQDLQYVLQYVRVNSGQDAIVIAHSMGGFVAQTLAREQALRGLALLASVPPEGLFGSALHLLWRHPGLLDGLGHLQYGQRLPQPAKLRELLFSPELDETLLRSYCMRLQHESDRALIDMNLPQFDFRPLLLPTKPLVLGSEHDQLIPPTLLHGMARQFGVDATVLNGPGHLMMLDRDWRRVAGELAKWLGGK